ncbi:tryptophan--tRNA ligase [Patescibacteria group bacterium]
MKKRLFSGIQPSGELHLGNYLGAIKQWIELQKKYDSLFCIVDLHAITVRQDREELRQNIRRVAASYLACGVDPKKSTIFVQSGVPEHAEMAWVLQTFTQLGELERMTQFKDKAARQKKAGVNAGLFTYPALMAADILLYKTKVVPVGEDQKQHIELTRNIAERFNNHYGIDLITVPEALLPESGARIMGLDDPSSKMSKSASSEMNYISFLDDADTIRKKFKKAVTDSGKEVKAGADKPALTNLLTIYSLVSGKSVEELEKEYKGKGYGDFKTDLGEAVVEFMTPIQKRMNELLEDHAGLDAVLDEGQERAKKIAHKTLREIYEMVGLGYG